MESHKVGSMNAESRMIESLMISGASVYRVIKLSMIAAITINGAI
jgi:hypothetical protein